MYLPYLPETPERREPVVLGIESSCDETAAAVVRGRHILSDEIASSADTQSLFGGVVPEIASRAHTEAISAVVRRAVGKSGVGFDGIDAVAVTYGAGLLGALLVGLSFAKGLAYALNVPLIAVNHIRGHLAAAYLDDLSLKPPFITLLASGGHTAILKTTSFTRFEVLARTLDDAAGEAFDKCARVLGLPYPGGPHVQRAAEGGSPTIDFPSAQVRHSSSLAFSYSGLKTAAINYCHNLAQKGQEVNVADVAASFQRAAIEPLVENTVRLAVQSGITTVTAGGGVIANGYLRSRLSGECKKAGLKLVLPAVKFCTDNAAMIASEGLNKYMTGDFAPLSVNATAHIPL